jgi:hypothetical protein
LSEPAPALLRPHAERNGGIAVDDFAREPYRELAREGPTIVGHSFVVGRESFCALTENHERPWVSVVSIRPPCKRLQSQRTASNDHIRIGRLDFIISRRFGHHEKFGSSGISGERSADFQEEVDVIAESVCHAIDDFDAVVDSTLLAERDREIGAG